MDCADYEPLLSLQALGALDDEERRLLDEHLATGCARCTAEQHRARQLAASLAHLPEPLALPPGLRNRVLAIAGVESIARRSGWLAALRWSPLLAGLLLGLVWLSFEQNRLTADLAQAQQESTQVVAQLGRLQQALRLLNQPQTREVAFGQGQPQPPAGRFFVHPQRGIVLIADHLPTLAPNQTFEMWTIAQGGTPQPAGLFQSDPTGAAVFWREQPPPANLAALALSVEPASGSPAPTTKPIVIAALTAR